MGSRKNFIPVSNNNNLKQLTLPDCMHLGENCKCAILRVDECLGEKCSFRQSPFENQRETEKWKLRLNSIDWERQRSISRKYFGGEMPWHESGKERKNVSGE